MRRMKVKTTHLPPKAVILVEDSQNVSLLEGKASIVGGNELVMPRVKVKLSLDENLCVEKGQNKKRMDFFTVSNDIIGQKPTESNFCCRNSHQ